MSTTSVVVQLAKPGEVRQPHSGPPPFNLWRKLVLWLDRKRQRDALRDRADDTHLLDDIGLTRQQAMREASRHFWQ